MENAASKIKKISGTNGFIGKTLIKHMTSIVGAYFLSCTSVVITGIMVGLLVDNNGLAAVSLCLPIYYLFAAIGTLIHTGTSVLVVTEMGKKNMDSANRYYTLAYAATGVFSIIILILGLLFTKEIALFLGARDELLPITESYLRVLIFGCPAALLMYFPINYLRITSKAYLAPLCYLIQAMAAIIFTYLLIVYGGMGATGAALATVISNCLLSCFGIIFVIKYSDFKFIELKNCKKEIIETFKAGSPVALDSIGCLIRVLFLNSIAYNFAGTVGVCIIAIVTSVAEFSIAFTLGAPQSTVSLIAIFNSEKDTYSVRQTIKTSIILGLVTTAILAIIMGIFSPQIAMVYGIASEDIAETALALRVFLPGLLAALVTCTLATSYATTDSSVLANIAISLRNFIIAIPLAIVFGLFTATKEIYFISVALALGEILTLIIVLVTAKIISGHSKKKHGLLLLDDSVEKSGKIAAFSVKNTSEAIVSCSEGVNEFCEQNDLPPKIAMCLSLSIEEMLVVIKEQALDNREDELIDVRLFTVGDIVGLRIRNGGKQFNILDYAEEHADDMDSLGITMIQKLSDVVEYSNTFGANNLLVILK